MEDVQFDWGYHQLMVVNWGHHQLMVAVSSMWLRDVHGQSHSGQTIQASEWL